jgi:tripartite-type tricarboxylate transporter receptor subunit TctC
LVAVEIRFLKPPYEKALENIQQNGAPAATSATRRTSREPPILDRDIALIGGLAKGMSALAVNSNSPISSVSELIAFAKSNPGKINVGSGGVGTISHVSWAILASLTGVNTVHVPYRGEGPAMADLLGDQVQAVFPSLSPAMEQIRGGKLRALAVTGAARSPALPDVPTVSEFVPGYDVSGYWGVGAPKGTPTEIIERLSREISASVNDRRLSSRIAELGDFPFAVPASAFGQYVAEFTGRWGKTLREAGLKAVCERQPYRLRRSASLMMHHIEPLCFRRWYE